MPAHQVAVEIDQSAFPPEACDQAPQGGGAFPDEPQPLPDTQGDSGAVIDVLVVYTPAAKNAEGGTTNMNDLITLAVAETNASYGNSGVAPRLNLVHAEEIAYTESGSYSLDLDRLRGTSDGYMDGVHALRDAYRADVVVLLDDDPQICGVAYLTATCDNRVRTRGRTTAPPATTPSATRSDTCRGPGTTCTSIPRSAARTTTTTATSTSPIASERSWPTTINALTPPRAPTAPDCPTGRTPASTIRRPAYPRARPPGSTTPAC